MAASRGRGLRPGGVVRAFGRLLVLIAIGFGVGLLFGVVTEEPELLASHLRGESRSVALDSIASVPPEADGPAEESARIAETRESQQEAASEVDLPAVASASAVRAPSPTTASEAPTPRAGSGSVAAERRVADAAPASRKMRATDRWSIQVGAFSEQAAAAELADGLRSRFPVDVLPASGDSGRWRVRIQPIQSEEKAREMAEQLKQRDRLPTWVTPMEGHSGS